MKHPLVATLAALTIPLLVWASPFPTNPILSDPEADYWSLYFNGTDELIEFNGLTPLAFADAWSLVVWYKVDGGVGGDAIVHIHGGTDDGSNEIQIGCTGSEVSIELRGSNPAQRKLWLRTVSACDSGDTSWHQFAFTWQGNNTLIGYLDGSVIPDGGWTKVVNGTLNRADGNSTILVGARRDTGGPTYSEWPGYVHSLAIWDSVLTASEITAIYNSGSGFRYLLDEDQGSYASSGDLVHWYRFGLDKTLLGRDYGLNPLTLDNTLNLTVADDIVVDFPN